MTTTVFAGTELNIEYRREHGVHAFETHAGTSVTAVSAPSWQETLGALQDMPETDGYIMTPELITCAGVSLNELADAQTTVVERTAQAQEVSTKHPKAVFGLGTVAYAALGVTNRLAFIQNGEPVSAIDKSYLTYGEMPYFLPMGTDAKRWSNNAAVRFAICSEMIGVWLGTDRRTGARVKESNVLDDATETLLASTCWAVPMAKNMEQFILISDEERYTGQLQSVVGGIFTSHPNLQEVIMTDRRPHGGTVEPLNAHFRRA
jgi:hypothetical protein